jgi:hypothetical protein
MPMQRLPQGAIVGALVQVGERLSPRQRRLLRRGEIRDVRPHHQPIEPHVRLTVAAGLGGVHLHAIGAPVHLRRPQLHQMMQPGIEVECRDDVLNSLEQLEHLRRFRLMPNHCRCGHVSSTLGEPLGH